MKSVKINKQELLKTLHENLVKHRVDVKAAFEGYNRESQKALKKNLKALKNNSKHIVNFSEIPPESHAEDYERAIAMLSMSVDEEIVLDMDDFRNFVEDNWNWKRAWIMTNSKYFAAK